MMWLYIALDFAGCLTLNLYHLILGYYYPETDKTYDKNMRLIGKGNLLAGLLGMDMQTNP